MNISSLKEQILKIAKRCYDERLMSGTSGNFSALSECGKIVITPGSVDYYDMTASDIMVIEIDGSIVEGPHLPSSEWRMHAQLYKHIPLVKAVAHTHSPYATSFAVIGESIPVILNEMVPFIGGDIPVSAFAYPGTEQVGDNAAFSLKNRNACLMQNHGVLAVGGDLQQAYIRASYVEDAAKVYHMAKSAGTPILITEEQQAHMR